MRLLTSSRRVKPTRPLEHYTCWESRARTSRRYTPVSRTATSTLLLRITHQAKLCSLDRHCHHAFQACFRGKSRMRGCARKASSSHGSSKRQHKRKMPFASPKPSKPASKRMKNRGNEQEQQQTQGRRGGRGRKPQPGPPRGAFIRKVFESFAQPARPALSGALGFGSVLSACSGPPCGFHVAANPVQAPVKGAPRFLEFLGRMLLQSSGHLEWKWTS